MLTQTIIHYTKSDLTLKLLKNKLEFNCMLIKFSLSSVIVKEYTIYEHATCSMAVWQGQQPNSWYPKGYYVNSIFSLKTKELQEMAGLTQLVSFKLCLINEISYYW